MSEELIDEVITRYYKIVSEHLGKLSHHKLRISNLGYFQIKEKDLIEKIEHYKNALQIYENKEKLSMNKYEAMMAIKEDLKNFNKILDMLSKEKERKQEKKEEKIKFNSENNESN